MNEIITINTENYASMAKAMGLPTPSLGEKKTNILNRFSQFILIFIYYNIKK